MPYIPESRRESMGDALTVGELNYQLTAVMVSYIDNHGLSYDTFNDISGAMTEALAEFRRRVVVPYEDRKKSANGDVYPAYMTRGGK